MPSFVRGADPKYRLYYDGFTSTKRPTARAKGVPSAAASPYYATCSLTCSGGSSSSAGPWPTSHTRSWQAGNTGAAAALECAAACADLDDTVVKKTSASVAGESVEPAKKLPTLEEVQAVRREGDEAFLRKQLFIAVEKYIRAAELYAALGNNTEAATCWGLTGSTRMSLNRPFDAVVACETGIQLDRSHWKCAYYGATALEALGLLNIAEERLEICAKMAPAGFTSVKEVLARVQRKLKLVERGDGPALMEEITRFRGHLPEQEGNYWIAAVGEMSRTLEGRMELIEKGFVKEDCLMNPNPADICRRGSYVALKYRINKKFQCALSAAGLTHGVADRCVLPKVLRDPSSVEVLTEAGCAKLAQERLVVIDGAFSEPAMKQMKAELQALRQTKMLRNDPNDVCNPDQVARYMPFMGSHGKDDFQANCPVTMQVVKRVCGLPVVMEENLGLRLAAPESVMLACYPPGASYKMHLDNYSLQAGFDEVPRKVTILLYCNVGWTKSVGGSLRVWAPFDDGKGPARDIEPVSGRIVAFMSEEIWHAVTEAHEERYALTFWVHDRDKVEIAQ
mmetsp:Transcript_10446/g.19209  ORF Transcript_10446/g.19209 Transcript_10446/m.19209 type:complete len:566 (+) Transcript_10446:124-1821(+)